MALINCPECGKEISDKSKACIHCGYPFEEQAANTLYVEQKKNEIHTLVDMVKSCDVRIKIVAAAILLLLCFIGANTTTSQKTSQSEKSTSSSQQSTTEKKKLPYSKSEYEEKVLDFFYESGYDKRFCEYLLSSVKDDNCYAVKKVKVDTVECTLYKSEQGLAQVTVKGTFTAHPADRTYKYEAVFIAGGSGEMSKIPSVTSTRR